MKKFLSLFVIVGIILMVGCSSSSDGSNTTTSGSAAATAPVSGISSAGGAPAAGTEGKVDLPVNYSYSLSIYSGATSGSWYPATAAISNFLSADIKGLVCTVTPGAAQTNAQAIQTGEADFAFGKYPSTVQAYKGEGIFTQPCDKIRYMYYLYDETYHLVVPAKSNIKSVQDLKGKVLTTQTTGNLAEQMNRDLLSIFGMSYKDLKRVNQGGYDDSVQQMKDGTADAFSFATAYPASILEDLMSSGDYRVISFDRNTLDALAKINSGYIEADIPAGIYHGQSDEVVTFGSAVHMMCSSDLDDELVYYISKSIGQNLDKIAATHSAYKNLSLKKMYIPNTEVPLAKGTERYLKEAGIIKD